MDTARIEERLTVDASEISARAKLGLLFVVEAALFLVVIWLSAVIGPEGVLVDHNLSELGVIESTAPLFNLSLVGVGLLDLLAAWFWRNGNSGRLMPIILVTAGIGAIATGVVTVGIEKHLHAVVSAVGFLGHVAMPFAMAAGPVSGAIRLLSTIAGLSSVAFLIVWIAGMVGLTGFGPVGKGGMQLLILFPIVLWVVAIGGWLMVPRRFAARASGSDQTYKPTRA